MLMVVLFIENERKDCPFIFSHYKDDAANPFRGI